MNKTIPVLLLVGSLGAVSHNATAGEGCLNDKRTALGHAIGVLVYDSIVKDYSAFASVEAIAAGLQHASDRDQFALYNDAAIIANPTTADAGSAASLSVNAARSYIENWRSQSDQLGERFLSEYRQRHGQSDQSELITNRRLLSKSEQEQFAKCTSRIQLSDSGDKKHVCYLQLSIDENAVCESDNTVKKALASVGNQQPLSYGVYSADEVIDGWAQAFELLESNPLKTTKGAEETANVVEVLEVVIPPKLGYGNKGMGDKVSPNETLWFVMAVM